MADDPRDYFVDPQDDISLVWEAEWVLGANEGGGTGTGDPEGSAKLYLMPNGKLLATKGVIPTGVGARKLALPVDEVIAWDAGDKHSSINLYDGNKLAFKYAETSTYRALRANSPKTTGKWCLPIIVQQYIGLELGVGVATQDASLTDYVGSDSNGWAYVSSDGTSWTSHVGTFYGDPYTVGDVIEVLLDADAHELRFTKNGVVQNSGSAIAVSASPLFPAAYMRDIGAQLKISTAMSTYATSNGYALWH